ncbi:MAG: YggT family protein [Bacillota bacterium]
MKTKKMIYWVLALLETLLAFRLLLKLLGANAGSIFVSFIYSVSQAFIMPFMGVFRSPSTHGIETQSVLEPATLIAMIVYALIAYGIIKLVEIYRPA